MTPYHVVIQPSVLKGTLKVPPSKSVMHRALISAALSCGTSTITPYHPSDDIDATIHALTLLGIKISVKHDTLTVQGSSVLFAPKNAINVGESASTLRMLIPLTAHIKDPVVFKLGKQLSNRSLNNYLELYEDILVRDESILTVGYKPLPSIIHFDTIESSQTISGLLFAAPLQKENITVQVKTLVSTPYIDLTCAVLKQHSIQVNVQNNIFNIPGNQTFTPFNHQVEADYSQAAFFIASGLLHSTITLKDMPFDSLQADYKLLGILQSMGAKITFINGDLIATQSQLNGCAFDIIDCPDIAPILALIATQAHGVSTMVNTHRLIDKESNRLEAIVKTLTALGAHLEVQENCLIIHGKTPLKGGVTLDGYHDHRIVMMLTIAASIATDKITVLNAHAVCKSYPTFFDDFRRLNGQIHKRGV